MTCKLRKLASLVAAVAALTTFAAAPATADHGGDARAETRARVTCSDGTALSLRLRADDAQIRVDVELEHRQRPGRWTLVVLHERRLVARASLTAKTILGVLRLRRTVADWYGSDTVVARASGPAGEQCRISATV
jgi:hypothetical protein